MASLALNCGVRLAHPAPAFKARGFPNRQTTPSTVSAREIRSLSCGLGDRDIAQLECCRLATCARKPLRMPRASAGASLGQSGVAFDPQWEPLVLDSTDTGTETDAAIDTTGSLRASAGAQGLAPAASATSATTAAPERAPAPESAGERGDEQSSAASAGEAQKALGTQTSGSAKQFQWGRHWYPVALIEDLDPAVPTPFTLLGEDMVLWRDNQGLWRAHKDLCPHRLAPLSEGRIDEKTGDLQCSYHGWTFRGDGTCSGIPQADTIGGSFVASSSFLLHFHVPFVAVV